MISVDAQGSPITITELYGIRVLKAECGVTDNRTGDRRIAVIYMSIDEDSRTSVVGKAKPALEYAGYTLNELVTYEIIEKVINTENFEITE